MIGGEFPYCSIFKLNQNPSNINMMWDRRPDNFCYILRLVGFFVLMRTKTFLVLGVQELRIRPCPIVFVALSGGPKACMYKIFQVLVNVVIS